MNDDFNSEPVAPASNPFDRQTRGYSLANRILGLGLVLAVAGLGYFFLRDNLSLDYLATREAELRVYQNDHLWIVVAVAAGIYVLTTGFSIPGATALTLLYAWFFGFWGALLIVSFASTAGATVAFSFSRYLLGDTIRERFGERLVDFDRAIAREGAFYLFSLRLIPAVPFFVVNAVMGLTSIRTWTFWWVSQIGMLPGTIAYVYAGSRVPDLKTLAQKGVGSIVSWQLLVAFAILGVFPIALKKLVSILKNQDASDK